MPLMIQLKRGVRPDSMASITFSDMPVVLVPRKDSLARFRAKRWALFFHRSAL